ncbi:zinc-binding alcohol dehydrogenase [Roseomonas terrae]|uniref:Zinc-binding alcohol dehydrogenase n=1 Tax=Neoroseomonas terrae TaxID=424799 RepID=A0ABS5ED83_9PROT|nr:zinc-binding alcohol dehydrogenase [Neoroseomonas terrae]MBR0648981.1 zinc-binding alcohol dehydrogenase [Neoroseomonas terrae]
MIARALWTVAPGRCEIREEGLPPRAPDQALVRTLATGISRGTERLVLQGRVPESQHAAMRCPLQAGAFPFPVKYGYSAVGVVEDGPAALLGRRVFCLHPHQDRFLAPAAMCIPVPDGVPDARAVLAANMETAVNILWDARPLAGERALVIGAGVVGLLAAALLARMPGMEVAVCDLDPRRRALVESLGATFVMPEEAPGERDLIIHASADPAGLRLALTLCAFEARIVEASWYGTREAVLPLGEAFHAKRLSIVSTQVGAVAPAMRGRRTHGERMALALSLLADPRLDGLLGPLTPFAALAESMPRLLDASPEDGLAPPCPVITYGG